MGLFGSLFIDNKPLVRQAILEAIEEERTIVVEAIKKDIIMRLQQKETVSPLDYINTTNFRKNKKYIELKGISSKEMFNALKMVVPNAKYSGHVDKASGMFEEYEIVLKRTTDMGGVFVFIDACYMETSKLLNKLKNEFTNKTEFIDEVVNENNDIEYIADSLHEEQDTELTNDEFLELIDDHNIDRFVAKEINIDELIDCITDGSSKINDKLADKILAIELTTDEFNKFMNIYLETEDDTEDSNDFNNEVLQDKEYYAQTTESEIVDNIVNGEDCIDSLVEFVTLKNGKISDKTIDKILTMKYTTNEFDKIMNNYLTKDNCNEFKNKYLAINLRKGNSEINEIINQERIEFINKYITTFLSKVNKNSIVNNKSISEAAHIIAFNCVSTGPSDEKWMKTYNALLDNMYGNALYLGYGIKDGINIDINNPQEIGIKNTLDTLNTINAPKDKIEKALFRLLTEKKLNQTEKEAFLG